MKVKKGEPITAGRAGLDFLVKNTNQQATVYITTDPTLNKLTFTIAAAKELRLKPGTPVDPKKILPEGPSSFYLSFGSLLTSAEVGRTKVVEKAWNSACFMDGEFAVLALAPTEAITQTTVSLTLTGFTVAGNPDSGHLEIDYYNVEEFPDDCTQLPFSRTSPPDPGKKDLHGYFKCSLDPKFDEVVLTTAETPEIANELVLNLSNGCDEPLQADPQGKPPYFCLSFLYSEAPNSGSLTTMKLGADFAVSICQSYGNAWKVVPDTSGAPCWRIYPETKDIMGIGEHANVDIKIGNILSSMQPGTTLLYWQYFNLKGFNDGCCVAQIRKKIPKPKIKGFRAKPDVIKAGEEARLFWTSRYACSAELKQVHPLGEVLSQELNCPQGLAVKPAVDTKYDLRIFDKSGKELALKTTEVGVELPAPQIVFFCALPESVDFELGPCEIKLSWEVKNIGMLGRIVIDNNIGDVTGKTSYRTTINRPTRFQITACNVQQKTAQAETAVYGLEMQTYPLAKTLTLATNPDAERGALLFNVEEGAVSVVDLVKREILKTTEIKPRIAFGCSCMAPDGKAMYISNKNRVIYKLDLAQETYPVTVLRSDEQHDYAAYDMCVNQDSNKLYCVIKKSIQVINLKDPTQVKNLDVGPQPHKVLASPDGLIYVYDDNEGRISLVNPISDKVVYVWFSGIQDACGVAFNPAGTELYLARNLDTGILYVANIRERKVVNAFSGDKISCLCVSPKGDKIYLAVQASSQWKIRAFDRRTEEFCDVANCAGALHEMAISPDGRILCHKTETGVRAIYLYANAPLE